MVKPVFSSLFLAVMLMLTVLITLLPSLAQAHNVIGGVYAIGDVIEGEAGFSNGDMAKEGTPVKVLNAEGILLAEIQTDSEGFFTFKASQKIDYHFAIDMSAGHVLKMVLSADELPDNLSTSANTSESSDSKSLRNLAADSNSSVTDSVQLQQMIEQAVARQVKPLRQELAAYKEKAGLQDILGGIGYIFGLCGLGIWWQQRKQRKSESVTAKDIIAKSVTAKKVTG